MLGFLINIGQDARGLILRKFRTPPTDCCTFRIFDTSPTDGISIRLPRTDFASFAEFLKDPSDDVYPFGDSRTAGTIEKERNGLIIVLWRTRSSRKRSFRMDFDGRIKFTEFLLRSLKEADN